VEGIALNLGYKPTGGNYLRFPLWLLEIDWFSADPEKIVNPKPIPLQSCLEVPSALLDAKNKFCSFIVSNPSQPVRNNAFKLLSKYKQVDSAGRLYNNVGDMLAAGPGGGGGELKKHNFLKQYKFSITYENTSSPGYMTEKLLHAKAAGCVPIYWGDMGETDFDMSGCIDARNLNDEQLLLAVQTVDTNSQLWREKASMPALDSDKFQKAVSLLRECATRIIDLWKPTSIEQSPSTKPMEATVTKPMEATVTMSRNDLSEYDFRLNPYDTYFITGCNSRFFQTLIDRWLPCIEMYKNASPKIHAIVGLFDDTDMSHEIKLRTDYPWVKVVHLPTTPVPNFPDSWKGQHFLWKLWLLKDCVRNPSLKGSLCIYLDTGCMVSQWPTQYAKDAYEHGISVLNDDTQINKRWCHSVFNSKLRVTNEELMAAQIWAGACAFLAGHEKSVDFFTKAYIYGLDKEIIVGDKWTGVGPDGNSYGHRHDQSILSILSLRMKIHRTPLYNVYNDLSLRNTYLQKKSFYAFRSLFREHIPVVQGIDDAWLVNLDRRPDRLADFNQAHSDIKERVIRIPAIDGKQLSLTPNIARLFAPMPISTWMKGAMGCAMSHMTIWLQLANDPLPKASYLVLEDDVILNPTWKETWENAYQSNSIPSEYDIIYLGGILPPNRAMFDTVALKQLNKYIGKIQPNTLFGQTTPNSYFHVCTPSYVLSKNGANKLLKLIEQKQGCFAHIDHVMCGAFDSLNIYFLQPLVAQTKQDSDPKYVNSQFNNLTTVESYDSDIRDGSVFTQKEIEAVFNPNTKLNVLDAILDARLSMRGSMKNTQTRKKRVLGALGTSETHWIQNVLLKDTSIIYEPLTFDVPLPDDSPIVVYTVGNDVNQLHKMLEKWSASNKTFYILHLGDASVLDPVEVYRLKGCLGVVRNYVHSTLQVGPPLLTAPLGYQHPVTDGVVERDLVWSFLGTDWHNRKNLLAPFVEIPAKYHLHLVDSWSSPKKLNGPEMYSYMKRSLFVPCPSGENAESFRIYEALEAGAIPVLVRDNNEFITFLTKHIPLKVFDGWDDAALIVYALSNNKGKYEEYRRKVMDAWAVYKKELNISVKAIFGL
jgi:GR25 family glycosyltransferase involved in LPS biosynthesis